MKVYDIVNEAQSVGKGDYAGFVWDQPSGSRNITVKFPDGRTTTVTNQTDARRVADEWLQRSRPAPPPKQPLESDQLSRAERRQLNRTGRITRGGQTYTRAEIDAFTQQARDRREQSRRDARATRGDTGGTSDSKSSFSTKFRAVRRSLGTAGSIVLTVAMWNEIEETMAALYQERANGNIPNEEDYNRAVASAFGAWVTVALPAVISVLSTGGRAIWAALRRLNMASSIAMIAGGPLGVFAGVIKFVIWEAGTWVAAYYVSNSEWAQKAVASWIFSHIGQTLFPIMDMTAQSVANVDNIIDRVINPDTSQATADRQERDARRMVGLNPNDIASKRIGSEPEPRNEPAASPNNSTAGPNSSSSGSTTNPLVNPNLR
jgi:hypothetical protein